ncbi:hypothetical protein SAMN02745165_00892 [Malonomonas rubra DSM 5091]|uniref:Rubredoxin-like domain-containing protein n=1 Tax=Malonomonas rubra DSM 5091 TaxID=1122189 RepID=A0A1M6E0X8_MALRU|nr:DUF2231 domain-containing protein [Malonomonas rubra]SHI79157.1 hypothetical protein SAMN02745165_00892 [Malonomonas rubra DSM 5091]
MRKWKCTICDYIHEGEAPPDTCPVCGAESSAFVEITESSENPVSVAQTVGAEPSFAESTEQAVQSLLSETTLKFHLHPITVHAPNGIIPMAFIFLLIAAVFSVQSLDQAAFYSFIFTLLSMPAVLFTGYVTWKHKYRGALTSIFKMKIAASIVSVILLCFLVFWRMIDPDIFSAGGMPMVIYLLLTLGLVGAVGLAGHLGGKLVFKTGN